MELIGPILVVSAVSLAFVAMLAIASMVEQKLHTKREQKRKDFEIAQMKRIRDEMKKLNVYHTGLDCQNRARDLRVNRQRTSRSRSSRQRDMFDHHGHSVNSTSSDSGNDSCGSNDSGGSSCSD